MHVINLDLEQTTRVQQRLNTTSRRELSLFPRRKGLEDAHFRQADGPKAAGNIGNFAEHLREPTYVAMSGH